MKQTTISKGGQISIPAEVRHRWGTTRVQVDDRGDELVVRPLPMDPIAAARGSLGRGKVAVTSADARRRTREEEADVAPARGATR